MGIERRLVQPARLELALLDPRVARELGWSLGPGGCLNAWGIVDYCVAEHHATL